MTLRDAWQYMNQPPPRKRHLTRLRILLADLCLIALGVLLLALVLSLLAH